MSFEIRGNKLTEDHMQVAYTGDEAAQKKDVLRVVAQNDLLLQGQEQILKYLKTLISEVRRAKHDTDSTG